MRNYILLIILCFGPPLHAQQFVDSVLESHPLIPHPYVFLGPELMPGGYAPVGLLEGTGIRIDSEHFIFDGNTWYDNGHKVKDNTEPNPKGHDRGLVGSAYYRFSSAWAFGAGARWSQLSTTNYTKSSWRPTFGGSRDFFLKNCIAEGCRGDFTMRIGADYFLRGQDWQNGSQGVILSLYVPSPSLKRHFFYRENIGISRFHDTVTTRLDANVAARERSNHHMDGFSEFTIMYRF